MTKRIWISGAAGFIGFHSACQLVKRGDTVIGYDNFNDYYDPKLKMDRVQILNSMGVSVVQGDVQNKLQLEKAIDNFKPTHLLHLAAQAGVRYSLENPEAYLRSNIDGFLNILEICRYRPGLPLVYASSSSVYGNNTKIPFSISDPTDHQASLYGVTKKTNELMAQTYHHLFNIPVTGLRFFTVYGPWGRPDMAYYSFAKDILENRPIKVFNEGAMLRDFTYIDDIVDGIERAIDLESSQALFNLGNHRPEKLGHLIQYLEESLGKKSEKILLPMQQGDVLSTYADIVESEEQLGFQPKVSLKEGIGRFVDWFKDYYPKGKLLSDV